MRLQEDAAGLVQLLAQELFAAQVILLTLWVVLAGSLIAISHYRSKISIRPDTRAPTYGMFMPLLWSILYLVFLLISRSVQHVDLDTRMLGVIVPFLLLAVVGLTQYLSRSLPAPIAALPLTCIMLLAAYSGVICHKELVVNLRSERSPGFVNNVGLRSITESRFDIFREISQNVKIGNRDIVLTDIPRPQILSYFFGDALVKMIPHTEGKIDFEALTSLENKHGMAILYRSDLQQDFINHYSQLQSPLRATRVQSHGQTYLIVDFPLR